MAPVDTPSNKPTRAEGQTISHSRSPLSRGAPLCQLQLQQADEEQGESSSSESSSSPLPQKRTYGGASEMDMEVTESVPPEEEENDDDEVEIIEVRGGPNKDAEGDDDNGSGEGNDDDDNNDGSSDSDESTDGEREEAREHGDSDDSGMSYDEDSDESEEEEEMQPTRRSTRISASASRKKRAVEAQRSISSRSSTREETDEDEGEKEYGRGKRKVKSRTIMVNGDAVLAINNYVLRGEENVYGEEKAGYVSRKRRPSVKEQRKAAKPAPRKQHKPKESGVGARLRASNETIRAARASDVPSRERFLVHHLKVLEPFLDQHVLDKLKRLARSQAGGKAAIEEPQLLPVQPEAIVGGEMRDYQLQGLSWLISMFKNGVGAILGDEMGLGKTIQTIAFLAWQRFERKLSGPFLIVCPLSVISGWMAELKKWCPSLRAIRLHTSDIEERKRQCAHLLPDVEAYDVIVTTYEMMKNPVCRHMLVSGIHWRMVVFDEGHCLKNEESDISLVARKLHAQNMLILTGTPLQNNLHELWALLSLLLPDVFPHSTKFDDCFQITSGQAVLDKEQLTNAHHLLRPFMIRRLKETVEKLLPPRIETVVDCPLSDMQLHWYKRLLQKEAAVLSRTEDKKASGSDWKRLQMLWVQLRKCCDHPFLFPSAEDNIDATTLEMLIEACGKMQVLDRMLDKLEQRGHRVVIFSQFARMLDILEDYCRMKGLRYTRLDGSKNRVQRWVSITTFNAPDSDLFVFLCTTRAGGLGVNLQTADTVILYDQDWNPQPDLQAMARVHRIGQTKVVHVYRFVTSQTIEERVSQHAEKKLYLSQMVNRDMLDDSAFSGRGCSGDDEEETDVPKECDMLSALVFGADRLFRSQEHGAPPTDEELDAILDRSLSTEQRTVALQAHKKDAASFDASAGFHSVRDLKGVMYEATPSTLEDIGQEWLAQKKRVGKQRLRMVDGSGSGYGGSVPVLASNMYDLETGEGSVFERELQGAEVKDFKDVKRKRLVAQRDFGHDDWCLQCWDGGELLCCDWCPAAYHLACLGLRSKDIGKGQWSCPQHRCAKCDRPGSAVGGTLFRCLCCPLAFCLDHLPEGHTFKGDTNERFEALGFPANPQAYFILCSETCRKYARTELPKLDLPTFEPPPEPAKKKAPPPPPQPAKKKAKTSQPGKVRTSPSASSKPVTMAVQQQQRTPPPATYQPVMTAQQQLQYAAYRNMMAAAWQPVAAYPGLQAPAAMAVAQPAPPAQPVMMNLQQAQQLWQAQVARAQQQQQQAAGCHQS